MTANGYSQTTDALAAALGSWAAKTKPLKKGDYFRVQGLDLSNRIMGLDDLFFVDKHDHFRPRPGTE